MKVVLDSQATKSLEQQAVQQGVSYFTLMENAGAAAALHLKAKAAGKHLAIVCGKGNNGGDGFVVARQLSPVAEKISVILVQGTPVTDSAEQMFKRLPHTVEIFNWQTDTEAGRMALYSADIIVDAVYGIGFRGSLPGELHPLAEAIANAGAQVVALDLPSGIQCDTGEIHGVCIPADETISFSVAKPAHLVEPGKSCCGKVTVVSVGIPEELIHTCPTSFALTSSGMEWLQHKRSANTNKGTYGTLLTLCGSSGMAGAAMLSARAALRSGVGLVDMALPESLYPIVAPVLPEPVYTPLQQTSTGAVTEEAIHLLNEKLLGASAVLMGCGLGTGAFARSLVRRVLSCISVPLVLDADGINILAENIDILKTVRVPLILTPHPGEMARLMNTTAAEIQLHRLQYAKEFAMQHRVVLVLKGSGTIVAAPDGRAFFNPTGNPGMAKGGSGDVLAGMIASFTAQGVPPLQAALTGVYLHGLAGDRCADKWSERGMLPSDLIEELPLLFSEFKR